MDEFNTIRENVAKLRSKRKVSAVVEESPYSDVPEINLDVQDDGGNTAAAENDENIDAPADDGENIDALSVAETKITGKSVID